MIRVNIWVLSRKLGNVLEYFCPWEMPNDEHRKCCFSTCLLSSSWSWLTYLSYLFATSLFLLSYHPESSKALEHPKNLKLIIWRPGKILDVSKLGFLFECTCGSQSLFFQWLHVLFMYLQWMASLKRYAYRTDVWYINLHLKIYLFLLMVNVANNTTLLILWEVTVKVFTDIFHTIWMYGKFHMTSNLLVMRSPCRVMVKPWSDRISLHPTEAVWVPHLVVV